MQKMTLGNLTYKYVVGQSTVGIVPPSRKKHIAPILVVRNGATGPTGQYNGLSDNRVTPEEIASYIISQRIT